LTPPQADQKLMQRKQSLPGTDQKAKDGAATFQRGDGQDDTFLRVICKLGDHLLKEECAQRDTSSTINKC